MENIYCLSGLGADERIFKNLRIKGANLIFLPWVPYDKHDEMNCYAQKMAAQIPEKNPTILGLSFGGMLATEIANLQPTKRLFLISSAKSKSELPEVNNTLEFLVKRRLLPYGLFKQPNKILYSQFGATTEDEKKLLADIMEDTDSGFLGWAFKAILEWQSTKIPGNIIHLHGTDDKIIMPAFVDANYWIREGSHMMVYNKAEDISSIIDQHLS
jgi:pimeloyl-ACP methyl ester carboxylesterase